MNRRTFTKLLTLSVATIGLTDFRAFARRATSQPFVATPQQGWQTYSVIHEKPSFDLPIAPAFDFRKVWRNQSRRAHLEVSLGSYADGVLYTVHVIENPSPRDSIDDFIKKQLRTRNTWDLSAASKVMLDGVEGKAFTAIDRSYGHAQFYSKGDRLYQFTAYGAAPDDPRVTKFFSSISLTSKKDSIEISEHFQHPGFPVDAAAKTVPEETFKPKDVDKKAIVGFRVEPGYSEEARRKSVTGVVTLECLFSSDGRVNNIKVVHGLPQGLTERAIAAARKIRFVPAMKDGNFVSTWITIEYYFNLY